MQASIPIIFPLKSFLQVFEEKHELKNLNVIIINISNNYGKFGLPRIRIFEKKTKALRAQFKLFGKTFLKQMQSSFRISSETSVFYGIGNFPGFRKVLLRETIFDFFCRKESNL